MTKAKAPKSKPAKTKLPKLITSRRLAVESWRAYRTDWKAYLKILAVVAVPINLLTLIITDPMANSYTSFAAIIMNLAVIWAIVQRHQTGRVPKIAQAYYEGTASFVRYTLTTLALVIMLLPAAFAAALYVTGLAAEAAIGISGPEMALLGLVALIIASPSFFLLIRYGFSPIAVVHDDLRPMSALRRARFYTLGRFWPVAGRLVMLGLFLIAVSVPASLITLGLSQFKLGPVPGLFFSIVGTLTALPLANLYIIRLYRDLQKHFTDANEAKEPVKEAQE